MNDLYIGMKVILSLIVVLILSPLCLSSFVVYTPFSGSVEIKGEGTIFKFGTDEALIKSPSFNFGDLEDGGVIAAINNPYSSFSLLPSFSSYSSSSRIFGSGITLSGSLHLFSFLGERKGLGVVWKENSFALALLYGTPGKEKVYQTKGINRTGSHTLWVITEYSMAEVFSIRGMASMADADAFSFSFLSSVSFSYFKITLGQGRVQTFSHASNLWMNYMAVEINSGDFRIKHELKMEDEPVYLREYRDYEYSVEGRIMLYSVTLSSSIKKTFQSGREKREERINLSYSYFTLGYKRSTDSVYIKFEKDGLEVEYEDGELSLGYTYLFEEEKTAIETVISSKGTMKWLLEIEI